MQDIQKDQPENEMAGSHSSSYQYIEKHDVPGKAEHVLEQIEKTLKSLSEMPQRGTYPKELLALDRKSVV